MAKQGALKKGTTRDRAAAQRTLRAVSGASTAPSTTTSTTTAPAGGQGAAAAATELDRLIHERLRLGIVSALAVNESLSFNELKGLLKTTDGNLSVHARKLEEAEYVACEKFFEGRTPKTEYRLTAAGRRALERYLGHMEALIRATREQ
ncbi:MAG: winged helix-turn-helix domain-containing protein [Pyrinomonadaceae bacterium]